ncbi:Pentatricopeptide repeat-containing protein [Hibiscus syriacus]|uniref:Pentatricopeptide repeat-containing protein n=1 Tax=Hibiscus syriacus TaxID=106335 RepID=A0A6A2XB98_HIBSY|nr:pentatricopeptide repeat-containing protein At4g26680, mitochondrial [Hibiscus syriacus]KAE8659406.1 Pentatricopeptide repeat-containing protein [Hibiscus syriacus]
MNNSPTHHFSTLFDSVKAKSTSLKPLIEVNSRRKNWNPIPIPFRTIPEPIGQDLDFVNVAHSHLIHSDWDKLNALSTHLTPFRVKHVLLKIQKDHVLALEFFNWVKTQNPTSHSLETHSMILHILTKNQKFKPAESVLRSLVVSGSLEFPAKLFNAILYSYRICDSSPRVFDLLFKTCAHVKRFRNATEAFFRMKDYGILPTIKSCNAYLSSLLDLHRVDIAFGFYREMRRCRLSPNVYTFNIIIHAFCKSGKLEKAMEVFREMENMGSIPTIASYNTLIAGYCNKGLISSAVKLKNSMSKHGVYPNVVTFNTLINGFCKEGKLHEANKVLNEMKALNVAPTTVTYNTLINGYSQVGRSEMSNRLYEGMLKNGVKADILTYNALILGLCNEGKTKKAAYLVKELAKRDLVPNASTFSGLIRGQCVRTDSDRAFQLYKTMIRSGFHPNQHIYNLLISTFCKNEDFDGAVQVLNDMIYRSVVPESGTLSELHKGLCQCGKNQLAMALCKKLEVRHLMPKGFDKSKIISSQPENDNTL